MIKPFAGKQ